VACPSHSTTPISLNKKGEWIGEGKGDGQEKVFEISGICNEAQQSEIARGGEQ